MKRRLLFAFILLALLAVGAVSRPRIDVHAENANVITVHIDGEERTIATEAQTVKEALEKMGTSLGGHDKTEPKLSTEIRGSDFTINVYRARPITVVDGANTYTVMTAERSPRQIAEDAGFETKQEDEFGFKRSDDPFEGAPGTQMVIKRAKTITLDLYGTSSQLSTNETAVQDLLRERSITLDQGDEISVPLAARIVDGMTISIASVTKSVETVEEEAPFPEEQIRDAQQPISYRKVQTPGKNGKKLVTYEIVSRNGGEPQRRVVEEVITEQPVKQVVVVGAKKPPVAGPAEILTKIYAASAAKGIDGDRVARIAKCESGFNPMADSGYYKGLFQHDPGYWPARAAKYGFAGASIYDVDAQIGVSTSMMAAGGWSHWGCKG